MLSSRDTPFDEDGWALAIEDIRRLALLVGGGANDLNAGAIDADQQAINDLSTALNSHEIDPDAHPQYLKIADYSAFVPTYLGCSGGSQSLSNNVSTQLVSAFGTVSGTLSSSFTSGVFTAPADGIYQIVLNLQHSIVTSAATNTFYFSSISGIGPNYQAYLGTSVTSAGTWNYSPFIVACEHLSTGNTLSFYTTLATTASFSSASVTVTALSIVRLS